MAQPRPASLLICPHCESRKLRNSRTRGVWEFCLRLLGFYTVRCRDCDHRFRVSTMVDRNFFYARCPKCWRLDLTGWSEEYYSPAFRLRWRLALGAKRLRCDPCRCNFASFRRVKGGHNATAGAAPTHPSTA